jgi:uncharacterized membrane protein SirB2
MIKLKIERKPEASKFNWGKAKEYLADGLVIFFGVWLLFHLVLFRIGGWIIIGEPSKPILAVETAIALGIIALGIDRWRSHSKKGQS